MPVTGMNYEEFNHYRRVARNMNQYLAAPVNYGYQYQRRDGAVSYASMGLGQRMANQLNGWGMPTGIVNLGYRFGHWFDVNA